MELHGTTSTAPHARHRVNARIVHGIWHTPYSMAQHAMARKRHGTARQRHGTARQLHGTARAWARLGAEASHTKASVREARTMRAEDVNDVGRCTWRRCSAPVVSKGYKYASARAICLIKLVPDPLVPESDLSQPSEIDASQSSSWLKMTPSILVDIERVGR
jgi:hypothetical protein